MKILIGSYQCESNTFSTARARKQDFEILRGWDVVEKLVASKLFFEHGFEVVPMLYATALPSGKVEKRDYLEILDEFLDIARENRDADGIYLYFHGAMYVDEIGSGEEYFVKRIREIFGKDIPISVASDFHSNISDGLLENVNAMSGFRTAPHTDYDETEIRAANALVRIIKNQLKTKVMRFKIPVLLADAAVTGKEPYKSIMQMLKDVDKMDNVVACSVYNGQPWVDVEYVGASVVISYFGDENSVYTAGKRIRDTFWERRGQFRFEVPALPADKALLYAQTLKKPVFISDSGDNTTAGAEGKSTFFLSKILDSELSNVLIASLYVEGIVEQYKDMPVGTPVAFDIPAADEYSKVCKIEGTLQGSGIILGFCNEEAGLGIIVRMKNADIVISNVRTSFISEEHFSRMGITVGDYDYVVLKMGYLWPNVQSFAQSTIFALTPGTSTNDFSTLKYTQLKGEYFFATN